MPADKERKDEAGHLLQSLRHPWPATLPYDHDKIVT